MPKTAVLVIDMQKDFTRPEGRFYYPETTGEMMKTFPEKLNKMRDLGALVVIVYTAHPADEKEVNPELTRMFRDGKKASLVEGSAGAELEERIPMIRSVTSCSASLSQAPFWNEPCRDFA